MDGVYTVQRIVCLALAGFAFARAETFDELRKLVVAGKSSYVAHALGTNTGLTPAEVACLRGAMAYEQRDFARAARELLNAVRGTPEQNPCWKEAVGMLGRSVYLGGRTVDALPWLEKARQSGDHSPELLRLLGTSAVDAKAPGPARSAFAELFRLKPDSASAYVVSGLMFMRQDMEDVAEQEFQAAVNLDPGIDEAHFHLGELAIYRGEIDRAVVELTKEIAGNPAHSMSYYRLGDAYARLNRTDDARLALQRSIWLNPYFSSPFVLLGKLHLQEGDLTNAEQVLRHALGMDPNNATAHYLLGQTLSRSGKSAESKAMLEKARQLRSGNTPPK